MNLIIHAAQIAELLHKGQVRKYTGESYISHPMRVAGMACMIPGIRGEVVAAYWLHDTIEDCDITRDDLLAYGFPHETVNIVVELTNPSKGVKAPRVERKRMDRDHIVRASYWAKVGKLLDRLDNLKDMVLAPIDFRLLYAEESFMLQNAIYTADTLIDELCRQVREEIHRLKESAFDEMQTKCST